MKIRDGHATLNGDKTEHEMPSGEVEIIADDGRTLLCIRLEKDGTLDVSAGVFCKHGGNLLDDRLEIRPRACNRVTIRRSIYIG